MLEVRGEEWGFQCRGDVAEEGVLLLWDDGVAAHEAEAEQAVRVAVLHEGGGDGCGELDGLFGHGGRADGDGVGADGARGAGFVAVGDFEGREGHGAEGGGFLGIVDGVAGGLRGGKLRVEYPEIGGAGVKVHHQGLPPDLHRREEFRVAFFWCGLCAAGLVGGGTVGRIDDRGIHAFWHGPPVFAVCSRHLGNAIAGSHVPCLLAIDSK